MKRHHQILAAILLVQMALTVVVFWPRSSAGEKAEPLFPDLEADSIISLDIMDEKGDQIVMRKEAGGWVLPDADDYPVQTTSITPVLKSLVEVDTDNLVARSETSHRQLQVAEENFVKRVVFETEDGYERVLYVGSSPRYSASHVRVEGEEEVYLTDAISRWSLTARASSWVDASYLSVPQKELVEVTLENAQGTFTFVRGEEGAWTLEDLAEDEQASDTKISGVVSSVANLRLKRPLSKTEKASYGLDEPNAVVTLNTTEDEYTLTVGAHDAEDGSYVVKASDASYYVTVSEASIRRVVETAREDLLEAEPTPTPAS
ncbi:MAG: DUF4340 domain-containing protein [Chloroflexota bacterium]|nr:DUF4340 domain-containing protein [Chloroflexota bacterium]